MPVVKISVAGVGKTTKVRVDRPTMTKALMDVPA